MKHYCWLTLLLIACASDTGPVPTGATPDAGSPIEATKSRPSAPRPLPRMISGAGGSVRPPPDAGNGLSRVEEEDAGELSDTDAGIEIGAGGIRYAGGDGTSCEDAVVILGAESDAAGIAAEYAWLSAHHPAYTPLSQKLVLCGDGLADVLRIRTALGLIIYIYFDIDDFFDLTDAAG